MQSKLVFHPVDSIPDNHWAIKCEEEFLVGVYDSMDKKVLVKLNPTDRRGYRVIIQLYSSDMKSTFNRVWSQEEMNAVLFVASKLSMMYFDLGLFPQMVFAGNNSMEVANGEVLVGKKRTIYDARSFIWKRNTR